MGSPTSTCSGMERGTYLGIRRKKTTDIHLQYDSREKNQLKYIEETVESPANDGADSRPILHLKYMGSISSSGTRGNYKVPPAVACNIEPNKHYLLSDTSSHAPTTHDNRQYKIDLWRPIVVRQGTSSSTQQKCH